MDSRPRPNLFIVGAPKCGTSSLHDYLDQHPDVFMSKTMKEPDYFCTDLMINEARRKRTLDDYLSLFTDGAGRRRIGESSVWYLVSTEAANNIHAYDPAAKIVIMIRNPVDAAYSLHGQFIWSCNEDILDFEKALHAEEDRRHGKRLPETATSPDGLQYTRVFSFHDQIKRYHDTFPAGQVKVIVFEDFTKDTAGVYRETLEFLGLPPFEASLEVMNAAKPVSLGLNRFFAKRPKLRNVVHKLVPAGVQRRIVDALPFVTRTVKRPSKLDPAVRKRLAPRWRGDVEKLSALLNRDLMHWVAGQLPMRSVLDRINPRIVVPIVAGIGNALMAVPLVRQLKRALLGSHITIVARIRPMGEVFARLPEVDSVRLMRRGSAGMARSMLDVARADVCLIPFPSNRWQYVMLALASGAKRRVMHSYPVGAISALGIVPADRLVAVKGLHDVQQNLYLLRLLGIEPDIGDRPEFIVEEEDREAADRMLRDVGIDQRTRPIAVHVGSAQTILAQAKRWPAQQYADLIRQLRDRYGDRVVLLEGPDEKGVANEVAAHHPESALKIVRLSGPLGHTAALLERAEFYVGTDSGLAHLAAAVGTPPVTLFAPADPDRVCPYGYRNLVVQPRKNCCPCFLYPWESTRPKMRCRAPMCITEIKREDVLAAVERAVEMRAGAVAYG